MSTANLGRGAIGIESTKGVAASSPLEQIEFTSDGITIDTTFENSQTITGRRAVKNHFLTSIAVAGSIGFHLTPRGQLWALENFSLGGVTEYPYAVGAKLTGATASSDTFATPGVTWVPGQRVRAKGFAESSNNGIFVAASGSGANTLVIGAGSTLTDETAPAAARLRAIGFQATDIVSISDGLQSTTTDLSSFGLVAGQHVMLRGFGVTAMNTLVEVAEAPTSTAIKLRNLPTGWSSGAAKTNGTIIVYTGDRHRPGETIETLTYQRDNRKISASEGPIITGMVVDSISINAAAQSAITGSASILGFTGEVDTLIDSSPVVVDGGAEMTGNRSIARVVENGATVGVPNIVQSANLTLGNGLTRVTGLGYDGTVDYELGDATLQADLTFRAGSYDIVKRRLAETPTSFMIPFISSGAGFAVSAHNATITSGDDGLPGRNQQVTIPATLMANDDTTIGASYTITVFHEIDT